MAEPKRLIDPAHMPVAPVPVPEEPFQTFGWKLFRFFWSVTMLLVILYYIGVIWG
jgi:hypothetical protein